MSKRSKILARHASAFAATTLAVAAASPAQAAMPVAVFPQVIAAAALNVNVPCHAAMISQSGSARPIGFARIEKSAAISGGKPSKLELLRRQQSGPAQPRPAALTVARQMGAAGIAAVDCRPDTPPSTNTSFISAIRQPTHLGPNDFLASKRLRIRKTTFDRDWNRVRKKGVSKREIARVSELSPGPATETTLAAVNRWANRKIRYVEDRDLYGRGDYWASASTTLRKRAGDCEDIAIAKMQVLAALGVPHSAMYLTVARDLVRNSDHAVLVVKMSGRHWLLDNATDQLLDGSLSHDYRPIMSFSASGKWLHGYPPI